MSHAPKPQAASHMFWFFLLPCLVFMGWAAVKLVSGLTHKPVQLSFETKIENIKHARSPGDRWQSAYSLAQDLQKMIHNHEIESMSLDAKNKLYGELKNLLDENTSDARLEKYLLLTLGQMGDVQGLPELEKYLASKDAEVKFFASWGYIQILSKNKSALTPERKTVISSWLESGDASLEKIASSFLVQQNDPALTAKVRKLLSSSDKEVRWNAAVALASTGDTTATPVLKEMFDLKQLRSLGFKTNRDLEQLLAAALEASRKIADPTLLAKAQELRLSVSPQNPEGHAIWVALASLGAQPENSSTR